MRHRRRLLSLLAGIVLVGALPGIASANTTEAIAATGGMTLTLPGVPASIVVTLDGFGNIDTVTVDPTALIQGDTSEHAVTFQTVADGSTIVKVKAEGQKLTAKVKTSNLGDLVGDHVWMGDIFGTGAVTTVRFTINQVGSGDTAYLELTTVSVDEPAPSNIITGPASNSHDNDEDLEYESAATIEFFENGYTKSLRIKVETESGSDDDHEGVQAKLKIELRGQDRQELTGPAAEGTHTWDGLLCDGTTASVTYTVNPDGTVTVAPDGITTDPGASASIETNDDGFKVRFTDTLGNAGAYVKVEVDNEDGALQLKVQSKTTTSCDDSELKKSDHEDDEYTSDSEDDEYTSDSEDHSTSSNNSDDEGDSHDGENNDD